LATRHGQFRGFEVEIEGSETHQMGHFDSRMEGAPEKNQVVQSYYTAGFKVLTKSLENPLEVTSRQLLAATA
jgi:hypothetical protein